LFICLVYYYVTIIYDLLVINRSSFTRRLHQPSFGWPFRLPPHGTLIGTPWVVRRSPQIRASPWPTAGRLRWLFCVFPAGICLTLLRWWRRWTPKRTPAPSLSHPLQFWRSKEVPLFIFLKEKEKKKKEWFCCCWWWFSFVREFKSFIFRKENKQTCAIYLSPRRYIYFSIWRNSSTSNGINIAYAKLPKRQTNAQTQKKTKTVSQQDSPGCAYKTRT